MVKGISGGERKRTSIGYELITDPNFLLLDEPTSGLDSTTSLKIIRMLKKEAVDRKTTIICTIHSPSSEIFSTLDRLLLLQDGFEVYQGPVGKELHNYIVNSLGCKMAKFCNPADYFIKMAQAPHLCSKDLSLEMMVNTYDLNIKPKIEDGTGIRATRYTDINTRFETFAEKRSSSHCRQFFEIFIRNFRFLLRNRKGLIAIIFNSAFIALLMLSVWHNTGYVPSNQDLIDKYVKTIVIPDHPTKESLESAINDQVQEFLAAYTTYLSNLSGIAFMISNQLSFSASINVVL
jgi:hypothetical protein